MGINNELCENTLVALRKIMRAVDIHSRKLVQTHSLTGPQLILLREIGRHREITIGELARQASLGNATTTGIVDRLEQRGLVRRSRTGRDRRNVMVTCTEEGLHLLESAPPLLQEQFIRELEALHEWERAQILSSLERVALMMNAEHLDAAPVLANYPLDVPENALTPAVEERDFGGVHSMASHAEEAASEWNLLEVRCLEELPPPTTLDDLAAFLHASLKPYHDTVEDIARGIRDALSPKQGGGGFVLLMEREGQLGGALVVVRTGMKGYVPENLLLFVAVRPALRGHGLGQRLVERAVAIADGDVKLHVEYDNPAKRLYERLGFINKYAEMRYCHEPSGHSLGCAASQS